MPDSCVITEKQVHILKEALEEISEYIPLRDYGNILENLWEMFREELLKNFERNVRNPGKTRKNKGGIPGEITVKLWVKPGSRNSRFRTPREISLASPADIPKILQEETFGDILKPAAIFLRNSGEIFERKPGKHD